MDPLDIGYVIGVEGDQVDVQIAAPELRVDYHGKTYRIGRLGTYVTIPVGELLLIGYITRVGVAGELEPGPDPDHPRRIKLTAQLLGTVKGDRFSRGVNEYPTLGDVVRLGVDEDFELIFGCFDELAMEGERRKSFSMGRFAIDTDFEVKVLGKEFFAKHVAVMGNSGSGKSCTTAKIVEEAANLRDSQIVMFDMHGEYLKAFSDENGNPLPNVTYLSDRNLVLPYWMLSFEEFEQLFIETHNAEHANAQRIFLRDALEKMKLKAAEEMNLRWEYTIDTPLYYALDQLMMYALNMNEARFVLNTDNYAFARLQYRTLPPAEQEKLLQTRRMEFNPASSEGEVPHATFFSKLLGMVNLLESRLNDRRYDFLLRPIEQARRNVDLAGKLNGKGSPGEISQSVEWVMRQMLGQTDPRRNLTIIDLSGLPFDVVDTTVAVLTRAIFDFNFWSPQSVRHPVLLVFEEAHNYLPRIVPAHRKAFAKAAVEKVAKEGRKYGVSAMIVSQRPSEISETILSQCNTMILMRMNNPDDQEYAARVVSDQFRSLISLLPSLRPGEGFIIGDSVLMPMRTLIDMPVREPQSASLDFFKLWSEGGNKGDVATILDRWWRQDRTSGANGAKAGNPAPSASGAASAASSTAGASAAPSANAVTDDDTGVAERAAETLETLRAAGVSDEELVEALEAPENAEALSNAPPPDKPAGTLSKAQQKLRELASLLGRKSGEGSD